MRYNPRPSRNEPDLFDSTTSYRDDVKEFIDTWNSRVWLPKIIVTDRQCKIIRKALQRQFFNTHWRESFKVLARSNWLVMKKRPRLCLDWYLEPDNFDKIIEGKYIDQKEETHNTTRVGDDEEIL